MGFSASAFGTWVGGFFTAGGAAAAGGTAAGTAAAGTAAGTAAGAAATGAAIAGTDAASVAAIGGATAGATAGTGLVAGTGGLAGAGITASGVSAAATGASALYQLSQGGPHVNIPPAPQSAAATDQAVANAEQQSLQRRQAAGGLQSTTGTPGGQAGAILAPSTQSSKSILGG